MVRRRKISGFGTARVDRADGAGKGSSLRTERLVLVKIEGLADDASEVIHARTSGDTLEVRRQGCIGFFEPVRRLHGELDVVGFADDEDPGWACAVLRLPAAAACSTERLLLRVGQQAMIAPDIWCAIERVPLRAGCGLVTSSGPSWRFASWVRRSETGPSSYHLLSDMTLRLWRRSALGSGGVG
jgi:hypothetical protein